MASATPLLRRGGGKHAQSCPGWLNIHRIKCGFRIALCIDIGYFTHVGKGDGLQPTGGNKVKVLNLEDLVIEAATYLAISGECDVPVDNKWNGVDLVACGYYENVPYAKGFSIKNGVRLTVEDESIHIYKFENFGVSASASFRGEMVSSSVLVAIAKEWLA